ncbi:MAG: hypothetical protein JWQ49_5597 [Edaphobacter sp.]|nr:hypothetical protein [Edaphobacter sp.]
MEGSISAAQFFAVEKGHHFSWISFHYCPQSTR